MEYAKEIMKIPEVKEIKIRDFKLIKKADIKFTKGLNIILGESASGKTTIIKYLLKEYKLDLMSKGEKILFYLNNETNKSCLILDGPLDMLDKKRLIETLKNLSNSNRQIIATMHLHGHNFNKHNIKANIINTKDFEIKRGVD